MVDELKINDKQDLQSSRNVDDIPIKESKNLIDVSKYEGMRFPIATVKEIEVVDYYNGPTEDGKNTAYNPASTAKKKAIEISTAPLPVLNDAGQPTNKAVMIPSESGEKPLTVTARFNLKKELVEGKTVWVISKHQKSELWNFMRKMGVTKLSELVGMYVTITLEASRIPDDDRKFMRIVR